MQQNGSHASNGPCFFEFCCTVMDALRMPCIGHRTVLKPPCSFSGGTDVDVPLKLSLERLGQQEWAQVSSAGHVIFVLVGNRYNHAFKFARVLRLGGPFPGIQLQLKPDPYSFFICRLTS